MSFLQSRVDVRFVPKADIGLAPIAVALPPKADIVQCGGDVRFVPEADISVESQKPPKRRRAASCAAYQIARERCP